MRRSWLLPVFGTLLVGCGPATSSGGLTTPNGGDGATQTEAAAWSSFCRLTKKYKFYKTPEAERTAAMRKAITSHVHNPAVVAAVLPDEKTLPAAAAWRAKVNAAGTKNCPLVVYRERLALSAQCASSGDAQLCYRVGELYAKQKIYPGEERTQAPAHFERACINGNTDACARRADWSGGAVKWLERACRRGHKQSCERLAIDAPASPKATLLSSFPADDGVVTKVKKLYLSSIVDCFEAYVQKRNRTAKGKIAFAFRASDKGVTNVRTNAFDEGIAECIKKQISSWAFTGGSRDTEYRFCYQMSGKSMVSRRSRLVHPHLLAAVGRGQARSNKPRFGSSRRLRVAKPRAPRGRYGRVYIYGANPVGTRTTLSSYAVRRALEKRRFYLGRCFERHVIRKGYRRYVYAYIYMTLNVGVNGRVSAAKVTRARHSSNPAFTKCMMSVIKRTKFPVPKVGSTPTAASFKNLRLNFSTTYSRPYRADICDFESF